MLLLQLSAAAGLLQSFFKGILHYVVLSAVVLSGCCCLPLLASAFFYLRLLAVASFCLILLAFACIYYNLFSFACVLAFLQWDFAKFICVAPKS